MCVQALSANAHHNPCAAQRDQKVLKMWSVFFSRAAHPSHVGGRCFFSLFSRCVRKNLGHQEPQTQLTWSPSVGLVALCVAFAGADASDVQRLWLFSEDGGSVAPQQRWWRRVIRGTWFFVHVDLGICVTAPFILSAFLAISNSTHFQLAKESSEKCRLGAAVQVSGRDAQTCIVRVFHCPGTPPPKWPASPAIYEKK